MTTNTVSDTATAFDLPELHARAVAATHRIVAGVRRGQWTDPVPTSNTDVRTLVNHFVSESWWVEPLLAGEAGETVKARYAGDVLGDDPVGSYDRAGASADAAFRAHGALERELAMRAGARPMVAADFCKNRFVDLLVHGWEIAKATAQDTHLDPVLAEAARALIEPDITALRANGTIKEALLVPDDADAQTKLLAFFGYAD